MIYWEQDLMQAVRMFLRSAKVIVYVQGGRWGGSEGGTRKEEER